MKELQRAVKETKKYSLSFGQKITDKQLWERLISPKVFKYKDVEGCGNVNKQSEEWKKKIASLSEKKSETEDNKEERLQEEYANMSIGVWFFKEDNNAVQYQKKELKLSDFIKSKDWFEWGWRKDPSVNSMLVVMDEVMSLIEINNYSYTTKVYSNLNHITFNLLDLDKLEMSDELYVKMNSRGKNLSSFDIIKSTFEEEIQLQDNGSTDFEKAWREKVDGKWMYYFWQNYKGHERLGQDEMRDDLAKEYEKVIPVENN